MKSRYLWPVFAGLLVVLAAAGCGRSDEPASPGISDDEVVLGVTLPQSGPGSINGTVAKGMQAYFRNANANGGIDGRKVKLIVYDDAMAPPRAVENTRRLVERDQVFALVGNVGSASAAATTDYLNKKQVPQLFVVSSSPRWGAEAGTHPWTMGWNPDTRVEATAFASFLKRKQPRATVAALYQNDDLGTTFLERFEREIDGTGIELVAKESFNVTDATVDSQVASLAGTHADVFLNIASGRFAIQAIKQVHELGWKPTQYISQAAAWREAVMLPAGLEASEGIYSIVYLKNPADSRWAADDAAQTYLAALRKYAPDVDDHDQIAAMGWSIGETTAAALEGMEEPTRKSFLESAQSLDTQLSLGLPGIRVHTGEGDQYPQESAYLQQFVGGQWQTIGKPISVEEDS